jgi:hypothetical protein
VIRDARGSGAGWFRQGKLVAAIRDPVEHDDVFLRVLEVALGFELACSNTRSQLLPPALSSLLTLALKLLVAALNRHAVGFNLTGRPTWGNRDSCQTRAFV